MAVVINEFEVVPSEPPPGGTTSTPPPAEPAPPPQEELERWLEQERERCQRVWAH